MMEITNVLISWSRWTGLVLATEILSKQLLKKAMTLRASDVIGLSQRGGKVWGSVRFGEKVHSASIPKGEGDIIVSMEKLEGLRWINNMKKGAKVILNDETIFPNRVLIEKDEYPNNIEEKLNDKGYDVIYLDANGSAKKAGNIKTANIVLLGCLSKFLNFKEESWIEVIEQNVPKSTIDVNIKAFKIGRA